MPNRIIKESICTSENLDKVSAEAENLFYRLIVNCDDYGRLDARYTVLRSKCFPLKIDKITDDDITCWLSELENNKLLIIYTVTDQKYLQLTTWDNHQQIRAHKSKYPDPNGNKPQSNDNSCNQMITDDYKCPRNPIQSESNPNPNPIKEIILPDFIKEDLFNDFLLMRKKKKVPNTDRAIKLLINKLTEFHKEGQDINKVIENSIMRGWTGVFEERKDGANRGNTQRYGKTPERYTRPEELLERD